MKGIHQLLHLSHASPSAPSTRWIDRPRAWVMREAHAHAKVLKLWRPSGKHPQPRHFVVPLSTTYYLSYPDAQFYSKRRHAERGI